MAKETFPSLEICEQCGASTEEVEEEDYLNSCNVAGCVFTGPFTYHLNCGSQHREWCLNCGALLFDSADEPIEMVEQVYMCSQCKVEGIQPGHRYCGMTCNVPAHQA